MKKPQKTILTMVGLLLVGFGVGAFGIHYYLSQTTPTAEENSTSQLETSTSTTAQKEEEAPQEEQSPDPEKTPDPETAPEQESPPSEETPPTPEESAPQQEREGTKISFTTATIEGKTLSSDIFADYDLTLVNVWATWCGPCVTEMPYLQEVYQSLPANVNLITLCQDGASEKDLAKAILSHSQATFHSILPDSQISQELLPTIRAFPTTLFVDREGYVINTMEGAPSSEVTKTYLSLVNQVLASLELS